MVCTLPLAYSILLLQLKQGLLCTGHPIHGLSTPFFPIQTGSRLLYKVAGFPPTESLLPARPVQYNADDVRDVCWFFVEERELMVCR